MSVREYIGARYVPLFMGDWDNTVTYEPLSIVQYQGNSYTSRQYVPTGIEITNTAYWAETGSYNAQVEQYRQEVLDLAEEVSGLVPIATENILDDAVTTAKIADDAITTDKVIDDAITSDKIADDAITSDKVLDDAITTNKIADDAITSDKVLDDAITTGKIADDAITTDKVLDAAITTSKIADDAITIAKMATAANKIVNENVPCLISAMRPVYRRELTQGRNVNGGCVFHYEGQLYYAFAIIERSDVNGATIYIVNSAGSTTASLFTTAIGHAQNMTYLDGKLWIPNTHYPNPEQTGTGFAVFDVTPTQITYTQTVTVPGIDVLFDATLDDEYYYCVANSSLNKISRETGTLVNTRTLASIGVPNNGNGISISEEYNAIVFNNFGNHCLRLFDRDTLEPIGTIAELPSYGYVKNFEPEFVSFDGYDVYLGINSGYNRNGGTDATTDVSLLTIMKTNLLKQEGMSGFGCDLGINEGVTDSIIVQLDYVNGSPLPTLLLGLGNTYKFKYPQDVEGFLMTFNKYTSVQLNVASPCPIFLNLTNFEGRIGVNSRLAGLEVIGGNFLVTADDRVFLDADNLGATYPVVIQRANVVASISPTGYGATEKFINIIHCIYAMPASAEARAVISACGVATWKAS